MSKPKKILRDSKKRLIYFHQILSPTDIVNPFRGRDYVGMVWNALDLRRSELDDFGLALLRSGCRTAVFGGLRSTGWEIGFERAFHSLDIDPTSEEYDNHWVMGITWDRKTIEETVWAFLNFTDYEDHYFKHYLAFLIGEDQKLGQQLISIIRETAMEDEAV